MAASKSLESCEYLRQQLKSVEIQIAVLQFQKEILTMEIAVADAYSKSENESTDSLIFQHNSINPANFLIENFSDNAKVLSKKNGENEYKQLSILDSYPILPDKSASDIQLKAWLKTTPYFKSFTSLEEGLNKYLSTLKRKKKSTKSAQTDYVTTTSTDLCRALYPEDIFNYCYYNTQENTKLTKDILRVTKSILKSMYLQGKIEMPHSGHYLYKQTKLN